MAKQLKVEKTVTLLETMDDETLVKVVDFEPATSIEQALTFLGNDSARLLNAVNAGLESEIKDKAREDPANWHRYSKDSEGEPTEEVNGPFTGDILDPKKVSNMVLTFAKMFGYSTANGRETRRKIKDDAKMRAKKVLLADEDMRKQVMADFGPPQPEASETETPETQPTV
jgi:hypothetical protein